MTVNLANKLAQLLRKKELTANAFAKKSGIPQPTIHKILEGKTTNPGINTIEEIAANLDISPCEFFDYSYTSNMEGLTPKIPLYPWFTCMDIQEQMVDSEENRSDGYFFPEEIHGEQRLFCLKIEGNYYVPTFRDGDIVFFDANKKPVSGSYVVVADDHDADGDMVFLVTIEQIITDGIRLYLRSLNIDIPDTQLRPLFKNQKIIGTCIGHYEPFRK